MSRALDRRLERSDRELASENGWFVRDHYDPDPVVACRALARDADFAMRAFSNIVRQLRDKKQLTSLIQRTEDLQVEAAHAGSAAWETLVLAKDGRWSVCEICHDIADSSGLCPRCAADVAADEKRAQ